MIPFSFIRNWKEFFRLRYSLELKLWEREGKLLNHLPKDFEPNLLGYGDWYLWAVKLHRYFFTIDYRAHSWRSATEIEQISWEKKKKEQKKQAEDKLKDIVTREDTPVFISSVLRNNPIPGLFVSFLNIILITKDNRIELDEDLEVCELEYLNLPSELMFTFRLIFSSLELIAKSN